MGGNSMPTSGRFPSRELTVAGNGFNRWLVPTAMRAIQPGCGMAYGSAWLVVGILFCLCFFIALEKAIALR